MQSLAGAPHREPVLICRLGREDEEGVWGQVGTRDRDRR